MPSKEQLKEAEKQFPKQIVTYDTCGEQMKDKSHSHLCILSAEPPFKEVI
jgi:hypothetical protein